LPKAIKESAGLGQREDKESGGDNPQSLARCFGAICNVDDYQGQDH
jgi:hypothetical protein